MGEIIDDELREMLQCSLSWPLWEDRDDFTMFVERLARKAQKLGIIPAAEDEDDETGDE